MKRLIVIGFALLALLAIAPSASASTSRSKWNQTAWLDLIDGCQRVALANEAAHTGFTAQASAAGPALSSSIALATDNVKKAIPAFQKAIGDQPLKGKDKSNFKKLIAHLKGGKTDYATTLCRNNPPLGDNIGTPFDTHKFPPVAPTTTTTAPIPPQQASGQSDNVVPVTFPTSTAAVLHATYQGGSNFVVKGILPDGSDGDLFVNTIGNYDGVRLLNATAQGTPAKLQVQAQGSWTITISPVIGTAPTASSPGHYDGRGDTVVVVKGSPSTGHFKNVGDANFVVHALTGTQQQLVVNEIGLFDGTEVIPSGTILLEVQSNGQWSVDLS